MEKLTHEVAALRRDVESYRRQFERLMRERTRVIAMVGIAVLLVVVGVSGGFFISERQHTNTLADANVQACEQVAEVRATLTEVLSYFQSIAVPREGESQEEFEDRVSVYGDLIDSIEPQPCGEVPPPPPPNLTD